MKFRTEIKPQKAGQQLNPEKPVILLGSCFAENIAKKMRLSLWDASNPIGTLYNPLSIERAVRLLLFNQSPSEYFKSTLFMAGRFHRSWLFDSKTSSEYLDDCMGRLEYMRKTLDEKLACSETLFVTFGTSWCYFLADKPDFVVANCHKQPASMFVRRRISIEEIAETWIRLASELKGRYPGLGIVFTVSPVRHLKDGFEGNSRSKATLILAIEEICRQLDFCHYFPAFELVNDDLRDYRFYAADLIHPSEEAVDYIWDFFKATYLDDQGISTLKEGERILKAWLHRPLLSPFSHPSELTKSEEAKRKSAILEEYNTFTNSHPGMLSPDKISEEYI